MNRMRCIYRIARLALLTVLSGVTGSAVAGPPYVSDDPEPTDFRHYEIYLFAGGTETGDGASGAGGLDFNYGATPDLQLTAVFPVAYDNPSGSHSAAGLANIELAAKFRFLHKADLGWDVAVFPRLFLPSASAQVGEHHTSLLLPVWLQKDLARWSTFGGGGCVINRGAEARDFCLAGWALTRQVGPTLQLGAEIVHQTPDIRGGRASTGVGAGLIYGLNEHLHLLAYAGPGLQNAAATGRYSWYASILLTF
jgi:Putative MetA-pathway of phenol degradation